MRYKDETLTRFTEKALDAIARARDLHDPKACISVGNKKVGRVLNVSTMPLICCGNCSACRNYCYDVKAALFRDTVMNARARNTALAQDDLDEFVAQIKAKLTARRKRKAFRWHVGGDIISEAYLRKMCETALERPDWRFWTYTKMRDLVNSYIAKGGLIPENLTILYSYDMNVPQDDNPYGMPIAYTVLEGDTPPAGLFECPGNCEICLDLERGCPYGESVFFWEH